MSERLNPTVFGKIIAGEEPADIVYEDDRALAFWTKSPKARIHLLIVPKAYIVGLQEMQEEHGPLIGHLMWVAHQMAEKMGIHETGYRVFTNAGAGGGQTVFHLHFHLVSDDFGKYTTG